MILSDASYQTETMKNAYNYVNRREEINCEMIGLIERRFNQDGCDTERQLITFHSAVVTQFKTHLSKRGRGLEHVSNKKKKLTKI